MLRVRMPPASAQYSTPWRLAALLVLASAALQCQARTHGSGQILERETTGSASLSHDKIYAFVNGRADGTTPAACLAALTAGMLVDP